MSLKIVHLLQAFSVLFFVHCSLFDKISIGIVCSNGPTILAELLVFFWYWLTQVVLEKEAVKGC